MSAEPFVAYNRDVLVTKARSAIQYYDHLEARVNARSIRLRTKYEARLAAAKLTYTGILRRILRRIFVLDEPVSSFLDSVELRLQDKAVRGSFESRHHMRSVSNAMRQLRLLVSKDGGWETATLSSYTASVVETYCTLHIPLTTANAVEVYSGYGF